MHVDGLQTKKSRNKNMEEIGFTKHNTYTLALLTLSFIIGEISHFLIGVVRWVDTWIITFLKYRICIQITISLLVIGRMPFHWASNEFERHFIEHQTNSNMFTYIGDQTRTPNFWLQIIEYWTSNIAQLQPITI